MNTREKIPVEARRLAKLILDRCDDERREHPLQIFTEELQKALLQAFDVGVNVGKNVQRMKDLN